MDAQFIYLDGDIEREQLIEQIEEVRGTVLAIAKQVPETHHYTPRYNGQSLAVMLARLQIFDTVTLWMVKAASNGYTVRVPVAFVRFADHLIGWMFQKRLVKVSMKGIRSKEAEICEFIRTVPIDLLSKTVIHPGQEEPYTVEKAVQVYFVYYWRRQLALLEQVDGVIGSV